MNKHRNYYSVMGIEPSEKSVSQEKFEAFENQLRIMFGMFDSTEVISSVKKIYDEVKK